jgi:hypothetical protein
VLRTTAGLVAVAASAISGFDLQRSWSLLAIAGIALVLSGLDRTIPSHELRVRSSADAVAA